MKSPRLTKQKKERLRSVLAAAGVPVSKCPSCGSGIPYSGHRADCAVKERYFALRFPLAGALGGDIEGTLRVGSGVADLSPPVAAEGLSGSVMDLPRKGRGRK